MNVLLYAAFCRWLLWSTHGKTAALRFKAMINGKE